VKATCFLQLVPKLNRYNGSVVGLRATQLSKNPPAEPRGGALVRQ
jgi:hypothetical protein